MNESSFSRAIVTSDIANNHQKPNKSRVEPAVERAFTPGYYGSLTRDKSTTEVVHKKINKITCLGSGFVGGPTSAITAFKSDVQVTVVDINPERIAAWKSNNLPIYEPGLLDIVRAARNGIEISKQACHIASSAKSNSQPDDQNHQEWDRLSHKPNLFFSTDVDRAIQEADLVFVCVNTPTKSNGIGKGAAADLGFIEAATRQIAKVAKESKIVVEKSTVPCRTADSIREILSANAHPNVDFDVLSNPEFLAEGTAVRDLLFPDRVIIGSMQSLAGYRAAASLADVYAQWVPRERIITMNLWSSELSKLAANALLAQRISSVNALSAICEATGADVDEVSYACGLDSRIGAGMLKAGPGFGGSCFQKDIFNIVYLSESLHLYEVADYWRAIINMNEYQKLRFTKRIITCLFNNLAEKKIAVLGFAFKKDTSDTRESPAIALVSNFVAERAHVAIYDPKVKEDQIWADLLSYGEDADKTKAHVEVCQSAYAACTAADAVVVVTEWDEFSNKRKSESPLPQSNSKPLRELDPNRILIPEANTSAKIPSSPGLPVEPIDTCATNITTKNAERNDSRLDWERIATSMRKPMFVFDGRNVLDARKLEKLGFRVEAIGRASTMRNGMRDDE